MFCSKTHNTGWNNHHTLAFLCLILDFALSSPFPFLFFLPPVLCLSFGCFLHHLPSRVSATFCLRDETNKAAQRSGGTRTRANPQSQQVLLQGPLSPATRPGAGRAAKCKTPRDRTPVIWVVTTICPGQQHYTLRTMHSRIRVGTRPPPRRDGQTLLNVKANRSPKSSFVSRSIHLAMCELWCPPEAENVPNSDGCRESKRLVERTQQSKAGPGRSAACRVSSLPGLGRRGPGAEGSAEAAPALYRLGFI